MPTDTPDKDALLATVASAEEKAHRFDLIEDAIRDFGNGRPLDDVWSEIVSVALSTDEDADTANDPNPRMPVAEAVSTALTTAQADAETERIGHAGAVALLADVQAERDAAIVKAARTTDATGRKIREVQAREKANRESRDLIYESRQQERHKVSELRRELAEARAALTEAEERADETADIVTAVLDAMSGPGDGPTRKQMLQGVVAAMTKVGVAKVKAAREAALAKARTDALEEAKRIVKAQPGPDRAGLRGWPEAHADAYCAAIEDAVSALDEAAALAVPGPTQEEKTAMTEPTRPTPPEGYEYDDSPTPKLRPIATGDDINGYWSNGDPVHLITDGANRRVAPNLNGATWVPGQKEDNRG